MLRFADELILLLIDDKRGALIPIPEWSLSCALAGALLTDLALEGRIDTDPDSLSLLDATPLDDDLLDPVLAEIGSWPGDKPIAATTMGKRLVYNLMCRAVIGISAPEYFEGARVLFEAAFKSLLGLYPGRLRWCRLRHARERLDELTARSIDLHKPENRGDGPPDLVDHVLALHLADPLVMPETDVGLAVLEPLFAPIDFMGHAVPFMLYELLRQPELL